MYVQDLASPHCLEEQSAMKFLSASVYNSPKNSSLFRKSICLREQGLAYQSTGLTLAIPRLSPRQVLHGAMLCCSGCVAD